MAAGLKLYNLEPLSLTSGVAESLSSTPLTVYNAIIVADAANTGNIFVGGSSVSTTNGIPVEPGNTLTLAVEVERNSEIDLSEVYLITNTTGNTVRIACFRRRI
jgi:hypothetical protein